MVVLLYKDLLLLGSGVFYFDLLDDNLYKYVFGVLEDLKYVLCESIELLGNEVMYYLIDCGLVNYIGNCVVDLDELSCECLCYMYCLLFLFYIEVCLELGYVLMIVKIYL